MPDDIFVRAPPLYQDLPPIPLPGAPRGSRQKYIDALLAEIRILIRAIANDPAKRVSDIHVKWQFPSNPSVEYDYPQIVAAIACYDSSIAVPPQLSQIGLLQAIKDQLIALTAPATGLSIAYTSLIIGNQRHDDAETTNVLAKIAYGNLEPGAKKHRRFITALGYVAMLLALFAAWEATKASLGRSLLQVLEPLHAQQVIIAADKFKLEMTIAKDDANIPTR